MQKVREAATRAQCQNNLKQLGLAAQNYHDVMRRLPPALQAVGGVSVTTDSSNFGPNWAVVILPYLEQGNLYNQYAGSIQNYLLTGDAGWRALRTVPIK